MNNKYKIKSSHEIDILLILIFLSQGSYTYSKFNLYTVGNRCVQNTTAKVEVSNPNAANIDMRKYLITCYLYELLVSKTR